MAIDPGSRESAWVALDGDVVVAADIAANIILASPENLHVMDKLPWKPDYMVIEWVTNYGQAVGASVHETVFWIGRIYQQALAAGLAVSRVSRVDVKRHVLGTTKGTDTDVRAALIARYGGKALAIGTKAHPGPLKNFKSHMWSALAVAVTAQDRARNSEG